MALLAVIYILAVIYSKYIISYIIYIIFQNNTRMLNNIKANRFLRDLVRNRQAAFFPTTFLHLPQSQIAFHLIYNLL